jgi:hypothetical protein
MRSVRGVHSILVLPLLAGAGCGPTIRADFDSPEPAARNAAIVQAAGRRDRSAVADLVRMLDSDDPATRLLAINALERITGERLGYEYAAPEGERLAAIERWARHVGESPAGSAGAVSRRLGDQPE